MSDASVIANAKRQAELVARHRDINKTLPPPGTDGESLRAIPGMEQITDDMLNERATFNLKDHMAKHAETQASPIPVLDLGGMSAEELMGLRRAAESEIETREKEK